MAENSNRLLQVLSPYGRWKHPQGMQMVDAEAANRMGKAFGKMFGRRVPIYVGHPDDNPSMPCKAVGRVKGICGTEGGIAIIAEYYDPKIRDSFLRSDGTALSPRWQMERLPDGEYRPVKLISVGVTRNPNIKGSGEVIRVYKCQRGRIDAAAARISETVGRFSKVLDRAKACADCANEAEIRISSAVVASRVAARAEARATERPGKFNLSRLALERSRKFGEPYTSSFAAVRRQFGKISPATVAGGTNKNKE